MNAPHSKLWLKIPAALAAFLLICPPPLPAESAPLTIRQNRIAARTVSPSSSAAESNQLTLRRKRLSAGMRQEPLILSQLFLENGGISLSKIKTEPTASSGTDREAVKTDADLSGDSDGEPVKGSGDPLKDPKGSDPSDSLCGGNVPPCLIEANITINDNAAESTERVVTLTLEASGGVSLGDVNLDGKVDGLDVNPFTDLVINSGYSPVADINQDGAVNGLDVNPFVALVVGGAPPPITLMSFSENGMDFSEPEPFSPIRKWSLTHEGMNTIYVKFFDDFGNESEIESASIYYPPEQYVRGELIARGQSFFSPGAGLDPETHFPYDSMDDNGVVNEFTQPTLIGFYLQMLGDYVQGAISWDRFQEAGAALDEIEFLMDQLLAIQASDIARNGLLPWIELDSGQLGSPGHIIGLGDNANLSQSAAVMIGALEGAVLDPAERQQADAVIAKTEQFLNNQAAGYVEFIDPEEEKFRGGYDTNLDDFIPNFFADRAVNEFLGATAFVLTRYESDILAQYPAAGQALIQSLWDNLHTTLKVHTAQDGTEILSPAPFDGGAFQVFWPTLRNDELQFPEFRAALLNHLAAQLDWAHLHQIPGILSASQITDEDYFGKTGVPTVAETNDPLMQDIGSTYALASAYRVAPDIVLEWLRAIWEDLPELKGLYGFRDSARSGTEIVNRYLGIDIASTVLGLTAAGPEAFNIYLLNRGLKTAYDDLYRAKAADFAAVEPVDPQSIARPPDFPERSLATFSHVASMFTINGFPAFETDHTGVEISYVNRSDFGGLMWNLDAPYNARANRLVIHYTTINSPTRIKVELLTPTYQTVYWGRFNLAGDNTGLQRLVIELPDNVNLENVQRVAVLVEPNLTGDFNAWFELHYINFYDFTE